VGPPQAGLNPFTQKEKKKFNLVRIVFFYQTKAKQKFSKLKKVKVKWIRVSVQGQLRSRFSNKTKRLKKQQRLQ